MKFETKTILFLSLIPSLTKIIVQLLYVSIEGGEAKEFERNFFGNLLANLPDFKNLTHLELTMVIRKSTIEALMKFLNCCPNLQSLYFSEGFSHDVCLVENDLIWSSVPKCISSCLKMLNFKKFHGNDSEICFLKCILQHAFVFKKMNISCSENLFRDPNRRNEMKKALEMSSKGSKSCVVTFS
ncbi:hypothetical protein R6Q59_015790 [Mikania micrantha]